MGRRCYGPIGQSQGLGVGELCVSCCEPPTRWCGRSAWYVRVNLESGPATHEDGQAVDVSQVAGHCQRMAATVNHKDREPTAAWIGYGIMGLQRI